MNAVQLRLFPPGRPLTERFGREFFRRIPARPGVYLMTGEGERLLYVGQSHNLRDRLGSYRHLAPGSASRRLVRLVHQVRSITWEVCADAEAARRRENQLLRLHKPRFNVLNTRPEHYAFVGLRAGNDEIELRVTKTAAARPAESLHGAFKGLWRVRAGCQALARLLHIAEHLVTAPAALPRTLLAAEPGRLDRFRVGGVREPDRWRELIREFLEGRSDALVSALARALPAEEGLSTFQLSLQGQDVLTLLEFFETGPQRNRQARESLHIDEPLVAQDALDDLFVGLAAKSGPRPRRSGG